MRHKSATQPICRYCGGKIAKATEWTHLSLHRKDGHVFQGTTYVDALPQTKDDCKQYTNHQVMAVRRHKVSDLVTDEITDLGIDQFSTWDGESYVDGHFCNGTHARMFAYTVAHLGYRIIKNDEYPNGVFVKEGPND